MVRAFWRELLVRVIVSDVTTLVGIGLVELPEARAFAMAIGVMTVLLPEKVVSARLRMFATPPETVSVIDWLVPVIVPDTKIGMTTEQLPLAAIVPSVTVNDVAPAASKALPLAAPTPVQVIVTVPVDAMVNWLGKVWEKLVSTTVAAAFGLLIV